MDTGYRDETMGPGPGSDPVAGESLLATHELERSVAARQSLDDVEVRNALKHDMSIFPSRP